MHFSRLASAGTETVQKPIVALNQDVEGFETGLSRKKTVIKIHSVFTGNKVQELVVARVIQKIFPRIFPNLKIKTSGSLGKSETVKMKDFNFVNAGDKLKISLQCFDCLGRKIMVAVNRCTY